MTKLKLGSWQNIDFIFSKNNQQHVTINVTQLIFNASLKNIIKISGKNNTCCLTQDLAGWGDHRTRGA